mmetsp:Transcript_16381/g.49101  ORF Transcript_16381/g.49101 Transcript_16381/m.49101 type:complete len:271 (-) Transcript_16381:272-1084(-)|eukprot:CAMPEP_0206139606 /NCGR_PEP_ID=MMETSP1473-20131121/6701_1 /ASSEMBLY_ACC=CAM_ASM_001109 /TAXON_ID=1461547 /ORGANISM="Stichococcus sp, Strain RCC1054" /LENGTH=270 /DNA_ID=CAMNT_0053533469 /DNA_START=91 /DNA_END=903 /DNA_ORIENTATION=+
MQISGALTCQHDIPSSPLAQRRPFAGASLLQRQKQSTSLRASSKEDTATESKPASDAAKPQMGFRWDGTLQRWQTDKRVGAQVWDNVPMMETKTGGNYVIWPVVWQTLTNAGLKSVDAEEAKKLLEGGAVMVDIRTPDNFASERIPGAVNVPLFVPVEGTETFDRIKKFVMATAFAMQATERNKKFAEAAAEALPKKSQQIIVYCNRGGRLQTGKKGRRGTFDDKDLSFGIESRSLKGCYELMQAGYTNVVHLDGGISTWRFKKNPTEKR